MSYQLGIDLGTTFTAAAVCRSTGGRPSEPEVVTLGTRNATIPSVLFLGADGTVLVGEAAERRAVTDPDRVVREFKRRIGDPTPVIVGGRPWPAQELSARLVRWVVDRVAEREGGPAARIALTHPAAWGTHKKELLGAALAGQGVSVTFLPEPSAAAVSYAANQRVEPDSTIAVYDLGGGTFDAAVVRKTTGAGFDLLGRPEGIDRLGGIDFDQAVFDHVRDGLPGAFDALDESDPEVLSAVSRVRRECTDAKEALSADTETNIPVLLPGTRGSVRMHRSEFESLIGGQIGETVTALRRAVASAGLPPEALTAVLLVGGSSRIPLVSQMVSDQLGRPVAVDTDPKNAIAKGAALAVSPQPAARPRQIVAAGAVGGAGRAAGVAGAGVGLASVAGVAGAASAPPRPPYVPLSTPRPGVAVPTTPPGGVAQPSGSGPPPGGVRQGSAARRDVQQPASTAALRGYGEPEPDWDYAHEQPAGRSPIGLYIGIGALVALIAVTVALLASSSRSSNIPQGGAATQTTAPEQSTRAPATSRNPDAGPSATRTTTPPTSSTKPSPTSEPPEPSATSTAPIPQPTLPIDPGPGNGGGNVTSPDEVTNPSAAP